MSWYYKACKKFTEDKDGNKTYFWCIVEYFPDCPVIKRDNGLDVDYDKKEPVWSGPQEPFGETKEDLIECLNMMIKDAEHYEPFDDPYPYKQDWDRESLKMIITEHVKDDAVVKSLFKALDI